jgi:hypothetical protein
VLSVKGELQKQNNKLENRETHGMLEQQLLHFGSYILQGKDFMLS